VRFIDPAPVLLDLAAGFLAYQARQGDLATSRAALDEVYQGTLRLLCRLLILLHTEARGLLPVRVSHPNRHPSLTRLARTVAAQIDGGHGLSPVATGLWDDLVRLFDLVGGGDDLALEEARYYGGIFRHSAIFRPDVPQNAFFNTHRIADAYLAPALDRLTRQRDPETGRPSLIDYSTHDVEELGATYEALLAFHLEISQDEWGMKNSEWRMENEEWRISNPHSSFSILRSSFPIHLVRDKGKRRASGVYYTPRYIVTYIVERTLEPVLAARVARFRALMAEVKAMAAATKAESQRTRTSLEQAAMDALLGIKVCDPAMGSGHFLVYAADWLAARISEVLREFPNNPILRRVAHLRARIEDTRARWGIAAATAPLEDPHLLKRLIVKRCIYGVDLDPMAVELAKVSLWLDSFIVGAPPSFLDHHLRCGNGLIGTDVRTVEAAICTAIRAEANGQMDLSQGAGLPDLTALMAEVADRADVTPREVQRSAADFAAFRRALTPYKQVLDLEVSQHFGNAKAEACLRSERERPPEYHAARARAREMGEAKRFFHWDLEFPEVFVDSQSGDWGEEPGFDAIVGNPPYGIVFDGSEKKYLEEKLPSFARNNDLYAAFSEKCILLLKVGGWGSMIIPNTFIMGPYFNTLKAFWLRNSQVACIDDFGYKDLFEDPNVFSAIFLCQRRNEGTTEKTSLRDAAVLDNQMIYVDVCREFLSELPLDRWKPFSSITRAAQDKGIPLDNFCFVKDVGFNYWTVGRGKTRGESIGSRVFYDGCQECPDDMPFLKGGDFSRYEIPLSNKHWLRKDYEALINPEIDVFRFSPEFLEVPRKIVYRQTADEIIATLDTRGHLVDKTVHVVLLGENFDRYSYKYLLTILNSRLINYIYNDFAKEEGRTFAQVKIFRVRQLPIRRIAFTTPAEKRAALLKQAIALYEAGDHKALRAFTAARLAHDPEQADVVHDLLAHLAEQMMALHRQRQQLEKARDPFKALNRGAPFVKFSAAFADALKYGERLPPPSDALDIDAAHHDIDGLRLVPEGERPVLNEVEGPVLSGAEGWRLDVQGKLRDPADGWRSWQYEEDGRAIARVWVPVYRLPLGEAQGRYYQIAFRVLDEFAHAKSFPGGRTRSTHKKLQLTWVPAFDADADLAPLVGLSAALAEAQARIAATDALIDQIVYRLYGLTEEEVAEGA
jgi:uncharacterized coiled-coil protein SlyX